MHQVGCLSAAVDLSDDFFVYQGRAARAARPGLAGGTKEDLG